MPREFGHTQRSLIDQDDGLDAFDKELLAQSSHDRNWAATQGLMRISLPPRAGMPSSSSPGALPPSSPTVDALQQRHDHPMQKPRPTTNKLAPRTVLGPAPPIIQGIGLVPANDLPDRFRSIFHFPVFNAVQSRCFPIAFHSDDNLVLAAPTGSGKTVVLELAICQMMSSSKTQDFKVVYQAPTKSLCSERFRDWQARFATLGLDCAELTGDTDHHQLRSVQNASIIITTPEKWDSVTRKWKDHVRLMQLVKLFLIDEVHILNESRGATLEAVVSRMKSVGSDVRFIALSATVPNPEDIGTWLGKNATNPHLPAHQEVFGEEFRPVQLEKFVYGYASYGNDFAFEKALHAKLPEVIAKHSKRRSILIFCCTRNSATQTAKALAEQWLLTAAPDRLWPKANKSLKVDNDQLHETISAGVAFHHGGLGLDDRRTIEQGYLRGDISIICSTSTLAVGVNLPCYLVIIMNTVAWVEGKTQEYADLEIMQMLGRAGRPQFESSACAVILTKQEKVARYQRMVAGQELLESCLHLNLVDHLNAEISLGTIYDIQSAKMWLAGTFLFVRLNRNPNHYKLEENHLAIDGGQLLERICDKEVKLLQEASLVATKGRLNCTDFGDAMARYYVRFETMKLILSLPPKAKTSEILSVLAQAAEFRDLRMKAGEKSFFKELNKESGIRFPFKVDIAQTPHKISLLIQSELGGVDGTANENYKKHRQQYQQDKALVFQNVNRLIRCIIDCQLHLKDAISAKHALELGRSLGARVWDNSPLQLKQLAHIGPVAIHKLASAGVTSIEVLENTEAQRIEHLVGRNPPFGLELLRKVADFPKLRVSVKQLGKDADPGNWVRLRLKAEIGFRNDKIPAYLNRKPVFVCFLAETCHGQILDFRRLGASKLQNGHEVLISVPLTRPTNLITCHVACDEIAGTWRFAQLVPDYPTHWLRPCREPKDAKGGEKQRVTQPRSTKIEFRTATQIHKARDDFDDGFNDDDFLAAETHVEDVELFDIDDFVSEDSGSASKRQMTSAKRKSSNQKQKRLKDAEQPGEPSRLENGNFACRHTCVTEAKDCKHKCCHEGVKRPYQPRKKNQHREDEAEAVMEEPKPSKMMVRTPFEKARAAFQEKAQHHLKPGAHEAGSPNKLHKATGTPNSATTSRTTDLHGMSTDLHTEWANYLSIEDMPAEDELIGGGAQAEATANEHRDLSVDFHEVDEDDLSTLEAGMVGLEDSLEIELNEHRPLLEATASAGPSSSGMLPDPSLKRIRPPVPSDVSNDEEDFTTVGFETSSISPMYVGWSPPPAAQAPEDELAPGSEDEGIFATGENSSPDQRRPPVAWKRSKTSTDVFEDDSVAFTPPYKKQRFEIATPAVNARMPLRHVPNVGPAFPPTGERVIAPSSRPDAQKEKQQDREERQNKAEEEEQKKKWEGIDPDFYEEFKDFIELV